MIKKGKPVFPLITQSNRVVVVGLGAFITRILAV
jgi:hypothetical protein